MPVIALWGRTLAEAARHRVDRLVDKLPTVAVVPEGGSVCLDEGKDDHALLLAANLRWVNVKEELSSQVHRCINLKTDTKADPNRGLID